MKASEENDVNWYLVTIDSIPNFFDGLGGEIMFDSLNLIQAVGQMNFGIIDRFEGPGKHYLAFSLLQSTNRVRTIKRVLRIASYIEHAEWGDFFLFKEDPKHWNNPNDYFYPYLIAQADTVVRAIDGQYLYIYTQDEKVVNVIKNQYVIESIKNAPLEDLEFPY